MSAVVLMSFVFFFKIVTDSGPIYAQMSSGSGQQQQQMLRPNAPNPPGSSRMGGGTGNSSNHTS